MHVLQLFALSAWLGPQASAFCGSYVAGLGETVDNHASRLVVARSGPYTTLTMVNDVEGDTADFGFVMPVPNTLRQGQVRLVDRELIDRLEAYSAPRFVSYTCDELWTAPVAPSASGATSTSAAGCGPLLIAHESTPGVLDTGFGVVVQEWDLGAYTAYKLSAEEGEGLHGWLENEGFVMPEAAVPLFDEYLDQGVAFLALTVSLDEAPEERQDLPPVQLWYEADTFTLPLRAGLASSAGLQDLVLYTITSREDGRTEITNYPETPLPGDCLVVEEDFAAFYETRFEERTGIPGELLRAQEQEASGVAWTTEYSWGSGKCDPCPPNVPGLDPADAVELGYANAPFGYHVTRLHLRYTPDALHDDIALNATGDITPRQQRYIDHAWELEATFPMCTGEPATSPGACYSSEYWRRVSAGEVDAPRLADRAVACGGGRATTLVLLGLPLAVLIRRRRERSD